MGLLNTVVSLLYMSSVSGLIMPMTKTDGTLDVSSLLNHIALMEQTIENKASVAELEHLKTDLAASQKELAETKTKLTQVETKLETTTDELKEVKDDLKKAEIEIVLLKSQTGPKDNASFDVSRLKTDVSQLTNHVSHLTNDVSQLTTNASQLTTDVSQLATYVSQLTTGVSQLATNASQLTTDVSQLTTNVSQLTTDVSQLTTNVSQLTTDASQLTTDVSQLTTNVSQLTTDVSHLRAEVFHLQGQQNKTETQNIAPGVATFTRWGRTSCPANSDIVYKGYTGGTHHSDTASSASILCLPDQPIYANHTDTQHDDQYGSHIFGTEYDTYYDGGPFANLYNDDIPCVVCEIRSKTSVIMLPARNQCYTDWTLEYSGYLMGPSSKRAAGEYICVDSDAEAIPGGHAEKNGQVLYPVEGRCGVLPCPPYHDFWELTCAVCSK